MNTRVKICGITRVEDALEAAKQGSDAIGLVFYAASPRNVSNEVARAIVAALPPFVSVVGLFVNASRAYIDEVLAEVRLDVLQFHGDETPDDCSQFNLPFLKAIRVNADTNLLQYANDFRHAQALLLDAHSEAAYGGTGQTFDWNLIPAELSKPIILAGGLNADNVEQAIMQVKPYAVDVSGGVELSKGIKDADKIAAFMQGVRNASI
jgi:phosphoribosylanthranilate isomerase